MYQVNLKNKTKQKSKSTITKQTQKTLIYKHRMFSGYKTELKINEICYSTKLTLLIMNVKRGNGHYH